MGYKIAQWIISILLILFIIEVSYKIRQWNCARFGMDADILTSGCVLKGEQKDE